ncbi:hypothetical protein Dda_8258 [Drechslerella dactyloides]|uniref:Uncharacterized protein n=1 Tax=Drechslerella dactyloides TaxID=74499 RepID=A0AAD6IRS1_DREDA|nr:hypothetical protein Dda_8258 [Drechslerella dactyloides]
MATANTPLATLYYRPTNGTTSLETLFSNIQAREHDRQPRDFGSLQNCKPDSNDRTEHLLHRYLELWADLHDAYCNLASACIRITNLLGGKPHAPTPVRMSASSEESGLRPGPSVVTPSLYARAAKDCLAKIDEIRDIYESTSANADNRMDPEALLDLVIDEASDRCCELEEKYQVAIAKPSVSVELPVEAAHLRYLLEELMRAGSAGSECHSRLMAEFPRCISLAEQCMEKAEGRGRDETCVIS